MGHGGDFLGEVKQPEAAGEEVIFQGNRAVGPTFTLPFLRVGGGGLLVIA
jgi:hypothetical protein